MVLMQCFHNLQKVVLCYCSEWEKFMVFCISIPLSFLRSWFVQNPVSDSSGHDR